MRKINTKSGFTLLISIVVTSIMLIISFVILNIALKQIVLANSNEASQHAFYAADSGLECAMYWDLHDSTISAFATTKTGTIQCGGLTITTNTQTVPTNPTKPSLIGGGGANATSTFYLTFQSGCAIVEVGKAANGLTTVYSRGYNTCTSGPRRFERGITLSFMGGPNVDTVTGITIKSSSSATVTSGSLAINTPSGTASGDVMIATIGVRPYTAIVNTPAGWVPLRRVDGSSAATLTYWKLASGSEPASYTWTVDASTGMVGGILSFIGVDTASIPVNIDSGQVVSGPTTQNTAPSVTTTVANTMLLTVHSINSTANWTPPAGMSELFDLKSVAYDGVASNGISLEANYVIQASSGATGSKIAVNDSVDQDSGSSQIIALHPAGSITTDYALNKTVTALSASNPPWNTGAPANMTDGNLGTQAYNGTTDQYYSVNLGSLQTISIIKVFLGGFGYINPNVYTTSWSIEGMNGSGTWVPISSSASTPNAGVIYGYPSVPISQIRVRTQSTINWLGILEVLAY